MGLAQIGTLRPVATLGGATPHDLQAPGASALEQLVRVDLVPPAKEMRFGIIVRRAENREALLGFIDGRPAFELFEPPLGLFGGRPLHIPPWHASTLHPFRFAQTAHNRLVAFRRSTTTWTPKTIPFGFLIALLGGWVIAAALVGPLFNFGFFNDTTWQFSAKQWETQLIPGIVAVVGGLMLMTPSHGGGALGALLAFAAGAWLIVCPILYPLWSSGTIQPYGSQGMQALRWIGHFYGPGALIIYFAGYALGLFSRRTVVQDTQVGEPQTQRTVSPGT